MKNIGIFYGSTDGATQEIAKKLAEKLDADVFDVANRPIDEIEKYKNLIFGTSTWGIGDLQDDWEGFLPKLAAANLEGKTIALFALGDSQSYSETFVNSMSIIYNAIKDKGCTIVGAVDASPYDFDESESVIDGKFVGLALDEMNEYDQTEERIDNWIEILKPIFQ